VVGDAKLGMPWLEAKSGQFRIIENREKERRKALGRKKKGSNGGKQGALKFIKRKGLKGKSRENSNLRKT